MVSFWYSNIFLGSHFNIWKESFIIVKNTVNLMVFDIQITTVKKRSNWQAYKWSNRVNIPSFLHTVLSGLLKKKSDDLVFVKRLQTPLVDR